MIVERVIARSQRDPYTLAMLTLTPDESRIVGVLIEKAQTTPAQYPLTVNAIVSGCNQKNNRDPIVSFDEERVLDSLDTLRHKGVIRQVDMLGSRVPKYRHVAREALEVDTNQLVVLAELLLRGPQTPGELRTRASRMHPLESLEVVNNVLDSLLNREEPLVRRLSPAPGTRAERFAQLLCPDLHPLDATPATAASTSSVASSTASSATAASGLTTRVEALEREVAELREMVEVILRTATGSGQP